MGNKTSSKPGLKSGVDKGKDGGSGCGCGSGTSPPVLYFVAGQGDCEERTVILKIGNFSEFLTLSSAELAEKCLTFNAGTCAQQDGTKTAATWKFYFKQSKKDGVEWVGAYLNLSSDLEGAKAVALYSVSLSSGGNLISSCTSARREFTTSGWGWERMMTKADFLEKTKGTNALEVTLQVKVFSNQGFTPVLQEGPSTSTHPDLTERMEREVIRDLDKLLHSADGADIEVKVPKEAGGEIDGDSYTKKVHKGILMSRSTVFAKMFAEGGEMVEAKEGKVVIKDLSPKGLGIFLHYIYTGKVLEEWVKVPEEILNCAEKYELESLKQFCVDNLMSAVTTRNALDLHKLAKLLDLPQAKTALEEFIRKNTKAVLNEETGGQSEEEGTAEK